MKKILNILLFWLIGLTAFAEGGIIDRQEFFICPGSEISFDGGVHIITTDTVFYDTIHITDPDADSIYMYVVNMYPSYTTTEYRLLHQGESFEWHDQTISKEGTYSDVNITNEHGCDSSYYLIVTEIKPYCVVRDTELVEFVSFPVVYRDSLLPSSGMYDFHYYSSNGCDSIFTVIANLRAPKYVDQVLNICAGGEITFNGKTYSEAGTYYEPYNSDTIFKIIVNVNPVQVQITNAVFDGEHPYQWKYFTNGVEQKEMVSEPGTHERYYTNISTGCYDVVRLNLGLISTRTITFCGQTEYKGKTYTQSAIVYDTVYAASYEGDSVIRIYLDKAPSYFFQDTATIVEGETLTWFDYHINTDGVYRKLFETVNGCDSIYELSVGLTPAPTHTNIQTTVFSICEGDIYPWRNKPYSISGTYKDTVPGVGGEEDTIYVLKLTVNPRYIDTIYQHLYACGDEAVIRYNGKEYYKDAVIINNFRSIHNCDSIVKVFLHFNSETLHSDTVRLIDTQLPYYWEQADTLIRNAGTYHYSEPAISGCDKQYELVLIVYPTYLFTKDTTVCEAQLPFKWKDGPKDWENMAFEHTPGETKVYEKKYLTQNGTDSIYRLTLTIDAIEKKNIYLRGCQRDGVEFNHKVYFSDTTFTEAVDCDILYGVTIKIDSLQFIDIVDTICEHELPYILGHEHPDTIWSDGSHQHVDISDTGCPTTVFNLRLHILPDLTSSDSVFVCENDIVNDPVVLGNLSHPVFAEKNNGEWADERLWKGKWKGLPYKNDTILYNCDSSYFFHVIVRPKQKVPKDTTYYMCEGDSVQLFWPKTTWIKHDTVYYDTVPTASAWVDEKHNITYHDATHVCDSVTKWIVKFVHPEHRDTTAHILLGDSLWWGGAWRYYTGAYDSISAASEKNSDSTACRLTYTLHLIADTLYYFRDTVDVCAPAHKTLVYQWESGYRHEYTVPSKDTIGYHDIDTLITYNRRDSIYDLCINYRRVKDTLIYDTICEGASRRFDIHRGSITIERHLTTAGMYRDTITSTNGCDSIVSLLLYVRNKIPVTIQQVTRSNRELPYLWKHIWTEDGQSKDSTDTLRATGTYRFLMPNVYGCDSVEEIRFTVHQTHVFRDTIDVCALPNTTWTHIWKNTKGYQQRYTVPDKDSAIVYADTLETRIKYDSIFVLHVNYSTITITYLDETLCEGDSLRFGLTKSHQKRFLTKTGIYRDTLTRIYNGCDSIIELRLNVFPKYISSKIIPIADVDTPYLWHHTLEHNGKKDTVHTDTLYAAGTYTYRLPSIYACDSIDQLQLIINNTYSFNENIIICQSQTPYTWQNRNDISTSGTYIYNPRTKTGYDSIYIANITVVPTVYDTIQHTMCQGDFFTFHEDKLTEQGLYNDTLVSTQYNCDSILTLSLQVIPSSFYSESKAIFEGDSLWFHDKWLKEAGTYTYQFDNGHNCYDTHEVVLTILQSFHRDTNAIVCKSDLPFRWYGMEYSESGNYDWPTTWNDSTHVITTLHLEIRDGSYEERHVDLCEGNAFIYRNKEYRKNGFFFDTIASPNGCDSVIKYIISVHPTFDRIDTVHISDKGYYVFDNRVLNKAGNYEATFKTFNTQCDSIVHLVLVVHPSYFFYDSVNLCQGDTLHWHGQEIYKSGLYSDSLLTTYSFDSVYQLRVVVRPTYFIEQQYEIIEGYPTFIHGINISKPGIYYDTLNTIHGCDSIYQIVVNWARTFTQHWDMAICQGESFDFFGKQLTHSGEYTYTSNKGDSTIYLKLTVKPSSISEERILITPEDLPYIYNERRYETGGVYADTFTNRYNCDSISRLILVVTDHYSAWDQMYICPGSEIKIDGTIINEAGTYTFVKRSKVTGLLDSLYRVEVLDAPAYESKTEYVSICEGDTITFAGQPYWRSGTYTANLKTKHGCDSILHMRLTVNPRYIDYLSVAIPDYSSYEWRGKEYIEEGIYTQTYNTVNNCDSIYQLLLSIVPTQYIEYTDSICYKDTLYWHNLKLSEAGDYSDTVFNATSKTSYIYTMHLDVLQPTRISQASVTETAADVESFIVNIAYTGNRPTSYSIYFDALAHSEGFEDIINMPFGSDITAEVPMPRKKEIVYQEHTAYVRPNYYNMRLTLDNSICGSVQADSLSLLVRYPNWILEQNWDDVVAPLRAEYNGGYQFGAYSWYINDVPYPTNGEAYLHSKSLKPGDEVVLYATRIGESYAIPTAPLIIQAGGPTMFATPVLVYPSAITKHKPSVTLKSQENGIYKVYSSTGQLFNTGNFVAGEQNITMPPTPGCCLIQATTESGHSLTKKIMIY